MVITAAAIFCVAALSILSYFSVRHFYYPMPHQDVAKESGVDLSLIYAVMKAESGFDERAESKAGAMGLMQLMPSTAEFVCRLNGLIYSEERLFEGEYNLRLGSLYLKYLLQRFEREETVLAAYNAGEGKVREWLQQKAYSPDGASLRTIPFSETREYVKKVKKFRKIYRFFYH